MTVQYVFDRMRATYASISSYEDQGVVLTHWPDKPGPDEIVFSTRFRRPDRFRFEWTKHHPDPALRHLKSHHLIWFDGTQACSYSNWDGEKRVESEESLAMAVAGATGVSKGAALTVINLLMPVLDARLITDLQDLQLRQDSFEQMDCYCIRGRESDGDQHEFCLSSKDYLLRSVSVDRGASPRRRRFISQEIRREIRIDHKIDDHLFQFRPEA
jgi:hypothetical protein